MRIDKIIDKQSDRLEIFIMESESLNSYQFLPLVDVSSLTTGSITNIKNGEIDPARQIQSSKTVQ